MGRARYLRSHLNVLGGVLAFGLASFESYMKSYTKSFATLPGALLAVKGRSPHRSYLWPAAGRARHQCGERLWLLALRSTALSACKEVGVVRTEGIPHPCVTSTSRTQGCRASQDGVPSNPRVAWKSGAGWRVSRPRCKSDWRSLMHFRSMRRATLARQSAVPSAQHDPLCTW